MTMLGWILILLLELAVVAGLIWLIRKVSGLTRQFKHHRGDWILKVMEAKTTLKSANQVLKQVEIPLNGVLAPKSLPGKLAFWGVRAFVKTRAHPEKTLKSPVNFQTLKG